jgi:putative membrane protein
MMWGAGWDNWILGFVMMVLFWGGLVALVVFALRSHDTGKRGDSSQDRHPDAREILEERFARGEISADEFEQRRHVLEDAAR